MSYKIFLDDVRMPRDVTWVNMPLGPWSIARNYDQFIGVIKSIGLPDFISFDHDLADEHYGGGAKYDQYVEKTGYECAKWLVDYCIEHKLTMPGYQVHSLNPIGKENIIKYIENFKAHHLKYFHEKETPSP